MTRWSKASGPSMLIARALYSAVWYLASSRKYPWCRLSPMIVARSKSLLATTAVLLAFVWPALVTWSAPPPRMPAFPGAEGYGAFSAGGRGGRIIPVDTLADTGPGSFRAAVQADGPRTVVFRVSGVIEPQSRIEIVSPYITIAGQTAPGDGITLQATEQNGQMLWIRTHDVVIRHLAIRGAPYGRPGEGQVNVMFDAFPAQGSRYGDIYNVILDHLSTSWSLDENIAVWRNLFDDPATWPTHPTISDISIQNCLIAEGLYPHSTGIQAGGDRIKEDGRSVFNGGFGVERLSIHRNLFASNSHRCPSIGTATARVINNVVYNWSSKAAATHDAIQTDWIGNYFKPGPLSSLSHLIVHNDFFVGHPNHRFDPPSLYMSDNVLGSQPERSDWDLYFIHYEEARLVPTSYRRDVPLPAAAAPVNIVGSRDAYLQVLRDVGARARTGASGAQVFRNDPVDERILGDVRGGRGPGYGGERTHYTDPKQAGVVMPRQGGVPYRDDDQDGFADEWEIRFGLDPGTPDPSDRDQDADGYTDFEEFLNQTDPLVASGHPLQPSKGRVAPRRSR